MMHRVKVEYVVEIEAVSQTRAIELAACDFPPDTNNVKVECWTPKVKAVIPAAPSVGDETEAVAA